MLDRHVFWGGIDQLADARSRVWKRKNRVSFLSILSSILRHPSLGWSTLGSGVRSNMFVYVCLCTCIYIYIYWGGLKRRINEKMPLKVSRVSRSLGDVTYRATYEVKKKRKRRCLSRARLAVVTCFTSFINFSVEPTLIAPTIVFRIPGHF